MVVLRTFFKFTSVTAIVVLLGLLCVPASADFVRDMNSTLTGIGDVGSLSVYSLVTRDLVGAQYVFTYDYAVTYDTGGADVHIYGVANPNDSSYFDAQNVGVGGAHFDDPVYIGGSYANVEWSGGILPIGGLRHFSYKSLFAPQDIDVYAYAVDGGAAAEGTAIGMGNTIPEPGTVVALAFGLLGLAPKVIRRRK
ncbi:MAG: PEP-CTERM sorting domain-containing protein [Armatimonadetes bacterium]|nr:PEP-CTERM sorting domain-containing protein [Armatimonadota bacterium]